MKILNKHKIINMLGLASTGVLAGLALITLCPAQIDGANAESGGSELPVSVAVERYLTVALTGDKEVNMKVTPEIGGSFIKSGNIGLNISTNNPTGYSLTMSTKTGSSDLKNTENNDTIASVAGDGISEAEFPLNRWGYQVSSTDTLPETYSSIPASNKVLDNNAEGSANYNFNFGAKVDAKKSGTYANTIILSAVTNPLELRTLMDLDVMQDMNSEICSNTKINEDRLNPVTKQLTDIRDGKKYWVSKLADDNCWMVQNLALDIDAEKGLSATNTDITEDWNKDSPYPPESTRTSLNFDGLSVDNNVSTASWDLGEYIPKTPASPVNACPNTTNLDDCGRIEKYDGSQDTHYIFGHYYQWNTATAGSGGTRVSENTNNPNIAPNSICPKGWQLPGSQMNTKSLDAKYGKTFYKLFLAYGYEFNNTASWDTNVIAQNVLTESNIYLQPFYFTLGGNISVDSETIGTPGASSVLLSSSATITADLTYTCGFSTTLYPSQRGMRYDGFHVRCVAR